MDVRYTENRLREYAKAQGYPVTHAQFWDFVNAGLLPPPGDPPRWDTDVLDLLLAIRALGETVRPLARRTIILYGNPLFRAENTPSAETLWAAMQAVLPTIDMPDTKMTAVLDMRSEDASVPPDMFPLWTATSAETWGYLFRILSLDAVRSRIPLWYGFADAATESLATIPYEERVILFAIADLHLLTMSAAHAFVDAGRWVFNTLGKVGKRVTGPLAANMPPATRKRKTYGIRKQKAESEPAGVTAADRAFRADARPDSRDEDGAGRPAKSARAVIHTRGEWAFSEAIVQPEQADTAVEGKDEEGGDARAERVRA